MPCPSREESASSCPPGAPLHPCSWYHRPQSPCLGVSGQIGRSGLLPQGTQHGSSRLPRPRGSRLQSRRWHFDVRVRKAALLRARLLRVRGRGEKRSGEWQHKEGPSASHQRSWYRLAPMHTSPGSENSTFPSPSKTVAVSFVRQLGWARYLDVWSDFTVEFAVQASLRRD